MTQRDLVLDYMRRYGSITDSEARRELSCSRLSGRIHELRERGYEIAREWIHFENSMTGNSGKCAKYILIEKKKQTVGEIMDEMWRMVPIMERFSESYREAHNG